MTLPLSEHGPAASSNANGLGLPSNSTGILGSRMRSAPPGTRRSAALRSRDNARAALASRGAAAVNIGAV
jgi:hypothetical protein